MTEEKKDQVGLAPAQATTHPSSRILISVIVPAFEADVELRRCVDSIRLVCGGKERCEILVVMPARQVPAALALLPGERVLAESRPSIYGAMNDGIAASTGAYLYFLGKDDIVLRPFAQALKALEARKPSVLFCDVYWGDKGLYSGRPSRLRLIARNLCHQGIVYSREALARHGPYLRKMRVEADKLLNIRVLWDRQLATGFHYEPVPGAWYSGAGFSVSNTDPVFRHLYPAVLRRYVGWWAATLLVAVRRLLGR